MVVRVQELCVIIWGSYTLYNFMERMFFILKSFSGTEACGSLQIGRIFINSAFKSPFRRVGTIEVQQLKKEYVKGMNFSVHFKAEMQYSLILLFDCDVSSFVTVEFTLARVLAIKWYSEDDWKTLTCYCQLTSC